MEMSGHRLTETAPAPGRAGQQSWPGQDHPTQPPQLDAVLNCRPPGPQLRPASAGAV